MAAGVLSKPGAGYGPCENEDCGHRDCAWQRETAQSPCRICEKPIDYERRFFLEDGPAFVHETCLLYEIAAKPDFVDGFVEVQ